jgi:hypothetical protein
MEKSYSFVSNKLLAAEASQICENTLVVINYAAFDCIGQIKFNYCYNWPVSTFYDGRQENYCRSSENSFPKKSLRLTESYSMMSHMSFTLNVGVPVAVLDDSLL